MCYTNIMQTRARIYGFTLIELVISVTIIGIIAAYGLPRFQKSMEQSRVDMATANMETIWTAQRLFMAQQNKFTGNMDDLAPFLDQGFILASSNPANAFVYIASAPTETTFEITAIRQKYNEMNNPTQKNNNWSGTITLDSSGTLTGFVFSKDGSLTVYPSDIR